MKNARKLTGSSKAFSLDDLDQLKEDLKSGAREENGAEAAKQLISELMSSLKILATEDPQLVVGFAKLLEELKKVGE